MNLLMSARRTLAVGLIGYKFMGKAHSNAWRQAPHFFDLSASVRMKTICGRNRAAVKKTATKLGWENAQTDWRRVIDDSKIDIVDICTPNDTHCEIAVAAAQAGKAILCEKMSPSAPEPATFDCRRQTSGKSGSIIQSWA